MAEQDVNFQLVSTYLPLVGLLLRATALVLGLYISLMLAPATSTLCVALGAVAYFDALAFRASKLSVASGSLCPVALSLMAGLLAPASFECEQTGALVALWTVDLIWAVSCSSFLGIVVFRHSAVVDPTCAAAVWAACAVVHTQVSCGTPDPGLMLARIIVYYVSCALFFFHRSAAPVSIGVMHVFCHMLFVKSHVLMASIIATALITGVVYYKRFAAAPRVALRSDSDDLMRELRAAKAGTV